MRLARGFVHAPNITAACHRAENAILIANIGKCNLLAMPTTRRQRICASKANSEYPAPPEFPDGNTTPWGAAAGAKRNVAFDPWTDVEFHRSVQRRTILIEGRGLAAFSHHAAKAQDSSDAKVFDTLRL